MKQLILRKNRMLGFNAYKPSFNLIQLLTAILFTLLSHLSVYSQDFDFIQGVIYDSESHDKLSYAHLRWIENDSVGTFSNFEGEFRLPFKDGYRKILITMVGYNDTIVDVSNFNSLQRVAIELDQKEYELGLIEIVADQDYEQYGTISRAYYKESSSFDSTQFLRDNQVILPERRFQTVEAYLDIFKPFSDKKANLSISLINGRIKKGPSNLSNADSLMNDVFGKDMLAFLDIKGGPYRCLKLENINDLAFINDTKTYEYNLLDTIDYQGEKVLAIGFNQNPNIRKNLFKGVLYLDHQDSTIVFLKYGLSDRNTNKKRGLKLLGVEFKIDEDYGEIRYMKEKSRWEIKYLMEGRIFKIKDRRKKKSYNTTISRKTELVMLETDEKSKEYFNSTSNNFTKNEFLVKRIQLFDPSFWEDFDINKSRVFPDDVELDKL